MIKTKHLFASLFVLLMAALLYGIFRAEPPQELFSNSDKVGHVLIFFAATLSGRLSGIRLPDWAYWPLWAVLALMMEYLQDALWPTRNFSAGDAYANLAGVVAALVVWLVIRRVLRGLATQNRG
ncbi:VanZ family protein [Halieaceae bacterium IMCC14734]|uniref:VanZ family protein n=1 Tax=Candidatus Litorirhabdus singularis TaxID=2518993 RepID=A0ABT3TIG3_9GAMM|nr:hypothetical protein [Candidatus Litorirhabdus singularis]MCX2982108.1 VanZ family protein [Candidatus Litorirhabdus singularis]